MDPVLHAEMTMLVKREKLLEEELEKFEEELPVWKNRVKLALEKDMLDLAEEAKARFLELQAKQLEAQHELDQIESDKRRLRYESKRPSGIEVRRSQAMLDSVREGGLIDPDEAKLEAEIADLEKEMSGDSAIAALKQKMAESDDSEKSLDFDNYDGRSDPHH